MGLGTGLPLRSRQMGIPYEPEAAVARASETIDQLRLLWAGERLPSATPGLPPIQPMFPPTHRIPLVVAAYRKEFVALAGQKADGYLARPAESIPSLRGILDRLDVAAAEAGRDPRSIETAGYLLSLVDKTRREALNRAKREPFVIYMMSVLSDVSPGEQLRRSSRPDRAAWRPRTPRRRATSSPTSCSTRSCSAAPRGRRRRAMAFHTEAGLGLPLLQPVLQEEHQIDELIAAAALYATLPTPAGVRRAAIPEATGPATVDVAPDVGDVAGGGGLADDRRLSPVERARRRVGATWEILRPFAFTASIIPIAAGGALAAVDDAFAWAPFLAALIAGVLLHAGTNITNEIYDVRQGIDTITSPRASHAIVKGRMTERAAFGVVIGAFLLAAVIGVYLVWLRGLPIVVLGLLGLVAGWTYTAPPFQWKYKALGVPLVFLLMGPLMTCGAYFAVTGTWSVESLVLSVPVGCLVAAILHGNEWRDISEDTRAGIVTLSSRIGRERAHYAYLGLVLGAYMTLAVAVALAWLPATTAIAVLSLPYLARVIRAAELGAGGQARAIAMIDLQTARLHMTFGARLIVGVLLSGVVRA
jgi:1,4-dihydroxy-2-naphthoate octaprenyltransferase